MSTELHSKAFMYLTIVLKNLAWLSTLLFSSLIAFIIEILPLWTDVLIAFKEVGSVIVILLVIIKLIIEIKKLTKNG